MTSSCLMVMVSDGELERGGAIEPERVWLGVWLRVGEREGLNLFTFVHMGIN